MAEELKVLGVDLGTFDGWDGDAEAMTFTDVNLNDKALHASMAMKINPNGELASITFDFVNGTCQIWEAGSEKVDYECNGLKFLMLTELPQLTEIIVNANAT